MSNGAIPRLVTPLALAAAILVSFHASPAPLPVELPPGEPPEPSAEQTATAIAQVEAPGGPGHDRGSTSAPVTVLEFADFGCPYCARFAAETWPVLEREFVTTGRVRWKYVPFVMGMFPNGTEAARAAECAADQGRAAFGRMHDRLYAMQDAWAGAGDPAGVLRAAAAAAGLDGPRFAACYLSRAADARIRAANALADALGVRGTPTFFINGQRIQGALPLEEFQTVLRAAVRPGPVRGRSAP